MHKGGNGNHTATDGLYVSHDCGSTWTRVQQGRNSSDSNGGTNINTGSLSSLIIDPVDSKIMYAVSNYGPGGVWKSTNSGVDWDQLVSNDVGQYVQSLWFNALDMEPGKNRHLVAVNHAGCTGPYAPNCIAESRDAGLTWTLIAAPINWSEGNGVYIVDDKTMLFATNQDGLFLTTDDGANWKKVGPGASGAGAGQRLYKGPDSNYYVGTNYGVMRSKDLQSWETVYSGGFRNFLGNDVNLFTTTPWSFEYFVAPEKSPTSWNKLAPESAPSGAVGGVYMAFDGKHNLLYTSNYDVGLWRLVMK